MKQDLELWITDELEAYLSELGFRRRGLEFVRKDDRNAAIVWLEVVDQDPLYTRFVVQLGTYSWRLADELRQMRLSGPSPRASREYVQFSYDLGSLTSEVGKTWMIHRTYDPVTRHQVGTEIRGGLDKALGWLLPRVPDSAIRDMWLSRGVESLDPGTRRLLIRLLRDIGPAERLAEFESASS
jgi:hypothetical protein